MGMLEGKIALITGATSGIGKRIAGVFVEEGAQVVLAARRNDEGHNAARDLGEKARFIATDVSDRDQVRAMVAYTIGCFGRIDCLVNNAGVPFPMTGIADIDVDHFDRVMAINVRGVMLGMKFVVPHMVAQAQGSIINLSSVAGIRAGGFGGHSYAASKAAVAQLTRSVAAEVGRNGIRVNSISPGAIVTGIFAKNAGVEGSKADQVLGVVAERFATMQPVPRAGRTDDIANAAAFLASDKGSFIHGQDIVIDGGISLAGLGWKEGIEFRSDLVGRVKEAVEGLATLSR